MTTHTNLVYNIGLMSNHLKVNTFCVFVLLILAVFVVPNLYGQVEAKQGKAKSPRIERSQKIEQVRKSPRSKMKKIHKGNTVKHSKQWYDPSMRPYENWNTYSEIHLSQNCRVEDFRINDECEDTIDLVGQ